MPTCQRCHHQADELFRYRIRDRRHAGHGEDEVYVDRWICPRCIKWRDPPIPFTAPRLFLGFAIGLVSWFACILPTLVVLRGPLVLYVLTLGIAMLAFGFLTEWASTPAAPIPSRRP
jgi:hypothetical protein